MKINKVEIFKILVTALISAGIAFLQSLLTNALGINVPTPNPEIAGGIAIVLKSFLAIKHC